MIGYFSDLFGMKKESKKLKGWDDWDVEHNDPVPEPEIEPFVDPEERVSGDEEVYFDEKDDEIFVIDESASDEGSTQPVKR